MIPLHGIASRSDLPLPFEAVLVGAAVVLLITFWVLLFAWKKPKFDDESGTPMPKLTSFVDGKPFSIGIRVVAGLIWLLAAVGLIFGVDRIDNPAVGFIYVWLWVGLVILSAILGEAYKRTNPIRSLLAFRGAAIAEPDGPGSRIPAAVALLGFLYLELVMPGGTTLPVLRAAMAIWFVWVVVGHFIAPRWIERADPFEVYGTTVGKMSFWTRREGVIHRINPMRNLTHWKVPKATWAVSIVLLGGTAFDALSNTPGWVRMAQDSPIPAWILGTLGLFGVVLLVGALYALGCSTLRQGRSLTATMNALAPGLVPLIVGYCVAHYGTMFYLEGQRTLFWFSDPLGRGDNLFGLIEATPDVSLFAFPTAVAWTQVGLIVGGHVLGVLVTHELTLRRTAEIKKQLPLLLVMVGFTVAGLLLMFGG